MSVKFSAFHMPQNTRELLEQSSRPFHEVLGFEKESDCCKLIQVLQKEHTPLATQFRAALEHDAKQYSWISDVKNYVKTFTESILICMVGGVALHCLFNYDPAKSFYSSLRGIKSVGMVSFIAGIALGVIRDVLDPHYKTVSYDLRLRAKNEQNWMKMKLSRLAETLEAANKELNTITDPAAMEAPENKEKIATQYQILSLHTYFTDITNRYY